MVAVGHAGLGFQGIGRLGVMLAALLPLTGQAGQHYQVYVSNERSGDVTIIDGGDHRVLGTIGRWESGRAAFTRAPTVRPVYVALSGTPIAAPPQLDAKGNPVFQKGKDDDDVDSVKSDKSADAIGVVDVAQHKLTGKISAGSDPEEFSLSKDGTQLYISNEDVKTASVINIASGKVEHIIPVGLEPEGVATTPDGKRFYITCEAGGDVYAVETAGFATVGQVQGQRSPAHHGFPAACRLGIHSLRIDRRVERRRHGGFQGGEDHRPAHRFTAHERESIARRRADLRRQQRPRRNGFRSRQPHI